MRLPSLTMQLGKMLVGLAAVTVVGCGGDLGPKLTAAPAHASQFGYLDVTFSGDVASLGDIQSVTLGGVYTYNLRATPTALTVTIQGAPVPGPAELIVTGSRGRAVRHGAFSYDPPTTGAPRTWAAFGASVTQGTESMGIDEHTQTFGVTAQIARAAGVFLPLPIFDPEFATPLHATDFDSDCVQKPDTGIDFQKLTARITDPTTGLFNLKLARLSWQTTPQNFAVGGSKLVQTLRGGTGTVAVLEHVIDEPTADPGDVVGMLDISQIQRLEQLDADVVFCTDLFANDVDAAVGESDDLHLEEVTDLAVIKPLVAEMMGRLGKLHGQYFIANLLSLTFVPNVVDLRAKRLLAGTDTAASFDAKVAALDQIIDDYNAALVDAIAPYPNLHLLDFHARVEQVRASGIMVGGELLTVQKFGGFLSFDNLHPSDSGYASLANFFLESLNATLSTQIPMVDVDAVLAQDEADPARLRAAGFTCVPPQP